VTGNDLVIMRGILLKSTDYCKEYPRNSFRRMLRILTPLVCINRTAVVFSTMLHIIAIVLFVASVTAQERTFRRYTVEDGLSQNSVYAIAQDSLGFLWFGTADGVNRFDGYSFTVFRPVPGDQHSISSTFTRYIFRSAEGDLWFGHDNGISRFQQQTQQFQPLPVLWGNNASPDVYGILDDPQRQLWFVSMAGVFRTHPSDSSFSLIPVETHQGNAVQTPGVFSLKKDTRNRLWLCATEGLFLFDEQKEEFRNLPMVDALDEGCRTVIEDTQGNLWVGTGFGNVFVLNSDLSQIRTYSEEIFGVKRFEENLITQMIFDRAGRLWIGTFERGLYEFDPSTGTSVHYRHETADPGSLAFDIVRSLHIDTNDNLWIGTDGGGISVTQLFPKKFNLITHRPGKKNSLSDTFVKGIHQDAQGIVWIGTAKGLNRYDPVRDSCTVFIPYPDISNAVSNQVFSITEDQSGILWISSAYGICAFNKRSGTFRHYSGFSEILRISNPTVVFHTAISDSQLWLGANGILHFNTHSGRYGKPSFIPGHFFQHQFMLLHWDSSGTFWAGSSKEGLFRYDPQTNSWKNFRPVEHDGNSISAPGIRSIYEEKKDIYWIGTINGLNRYDAATGSFSRFFEKDGLPNSFIYGILPDNKGNLWLSTNRGLSRFHPATGQFRNYTVKDGLQSAEFNTGAYHRNDRNGWLFFGGVNGVTYFHPDSITDSQFSPPIVLTDLKKFDRSLELPTPFHFLREIILPYNENTITFSYAAMDFSNPQQIRYSYRLEGFEPEWIQAGSRRDVRYTNLADGEYIFRVRATNADGVMGANELAVRVVIIPPYWATAWFRGLIILLFIGMIAGIVRYVEYRKFRRQIGELEQQKRILEERQRTRDKIARDLHDDLASTVGSAGLFVETAKRTLKDNVDQSREYLEKTSAILNEAEEAMSDIVWSVSPKHDTLQSLSTRVRLVTNDLCRANGIGSEVEVKGTIDVPLSDEVRRGMYLIFKEALNNCLKHSNASKVEVCIGSENGRLILRVKDNGSGFSMETPQEQLGGNGIHNIRKRAEEIGAEISVISSPGAGTTVDVGVQMTQMGH
jgi:ligand-binding sensor domain-containing protein/signal transduction histidine kinase